LESILSVFSLTFYSYNKLDLLKHNGKQEITFVLPIFILPQFLLGYFFGFSGDTCMSLNCCISFLNSRRWLGFLFTKKWIKGMNYKLPYSKGGASLKTEKVGCIEKRCHGI